MRILMDEHGLGWGRGLGSCPKTFAYTNHVPETWDIHIFDRLFPRISEIVREIDCRSASTWLSGSTRHHRLHGPRLRKHCAHGLIARYASYSSTRRRLH